MSKYENRRTTFCSTIIVFNFKASGNVTFLLANNKLDCLKADCIDMYNIYLSTIGLIKSILKKKFLEY